MIQNCSVPLLTYVSLNIKTSHVPPGGGLQKKKSVPLPKYASSECYFKLVIFLDQSLRKETYPPSSRPPVYLPKGNPIEKSAQRKGTTTLAAGQASSAVDRLEPNTPCCWTPPPPCGPLFLVAQEELVQAMVALSRPPVTGPALVRTSCASLPSLPLEAQKPPLPSVPSGPTLHGVPCEHIRNKSGYFLWSICLVSV